MNNVLDLLSRKEELFIDDIAKNEKEIKEIVNSSKFLVIGGAGSIGKEVVKQLFIREPKLLHVVDLSENNLVELTRFLRSSHGYIDGDFSLYSIDSNSIEFNLLMKRNEYDFIINLSAMKHVRSEKDEISLMRMINTNIFNIENVCKTAIKMNSKKYFSVSTDKATNPVSLMGASKNIMELFLWDLSCDIDISTARFANVAFSDGSLLYGFENRIKHSQPISIPGDISRFFFTEEEAGRLCILSALLGENKQIFFPKEKKDLQLTGFKIVLSNYLNKKGYELYECHTEDEARDRAFELIKQKKWPCLIFDSDTTGEKLFEEFYTEKDAVLWNIYEDAAIIEVSSNDNKKELQKFKEDILLLQDKGNWTKTQLVECFENVIKDYKHIEKNKNLDQKM